MESINIMFHDVVSEKFPKSGYQSIGALSYTLTEEKFESFIKRAVEVEPATEFTFDDGGSCFYNIAAPILEKYSKRGVFFIITSEIGTEGFLTEDQIKELHRRGHIIASHSHLHISKNRNRQVSEIKEDWAKSKHILEGIIGDSVTVASIPGGGVTKELLRILADIGFKEIYTSEPTTKSYYVNGAQIIGRFSVSKSTSYKEFDSLLLSRFFRRKKYIRSKSLKLVKRILGDNYSMVKNLILARR